MGLFLTRRFGILLLRCGGSEGGKDAGSVWLDLLLACG